MFLCTVFINSREGAYGYTGWRLPNVRKLKSLYDSISYDDGMPLETHRFINLQQLGHYCFSTTGADNTFEAWRVYMGGTRVTGYDKYGDHYVGPVRGGH